jgi:recombination protein RecA
VAALVPKAEIDGEMGDSHVGLQARLMSQALRKLTGAISKSSTSVVFINQLREKIGVMFGNPEVTTGGRALKFYASVRLDVRKIDTIKNGLDVIGNRVKVKVVKNKVAPPFRAAEFDILYNEGISYLGSVLDAGIDAGIVEKQGSWFSYGEDRLGQGRENVRDFLRSNPDVTDKIVSTLRQRLAIQQAPKPEVTTVAEASKAADHEGTPLAPGTLSTVDAPPAPSTSSEADATRAAGAARKEAKESQAAGQAASNATAK